MTGAGSRNKWRGAVVVPFLNVGTSIQQECYRRPVAADAGFNESCVTAGNARIGNGRWRGRGQNRQGAGGAGRRARGGYRG